MKDKPDIKNDYFGVMDKKTLHSNYYGVLSHHVHSRGGKSSDMMGVTLVDDGKGMRIKKWNIQGVPQPTDEALTQMYSLEQVTKCGICILARKMKWWVCQPIQYRALFLALFKSTPIGAGMSAPALEAYVVSQLP